MFGTIMGNMAIKAKWIDAANRDNSCHNNVFNSSPPGQNGRHFADDIFWYIFFNEKFCILMAFSLKLVTKGPIDNNSVLV